MPKRQTQNKEIFKINLKIKEATYTCKHLHLQLVWRELQHALWHLAVRIRSPQPSRLGGRQAFLALPVIREQEICHGHAQVGCAHELRLTHADGPLIERLVHGPSHAHVVHTTVLLAPHRCCSRHRVLRCRLGSATSTLPPTAKCGVRRRNDRWPGRHDVVPTCKIVSNGKVVTRSRSSQTGYGIL